MCTWISTHRDIKASGKGPDGWFPVTRANVGYDHPSHVFLNHAVLLDFINPSMDVSKRVAVEMNVASAKALVEVLQEAIAAAEASGVAE